MDWIAPTLGILLLSTSLLLRDPSHVHVFHALQGSAIGYLFDLYGPTVLMACGTVCFVLSAVLTSISTHYYHYILSQGILFGVGVGLL